MIRKRSTYDESEGGGGGEFCIHKDIVYRLAKCRGSLAIKVLDLPSGCLARTFRLLLPVTALHPTPARIDKLAVSCTTLLGCDSRRGFFTLYDLDRSVPLCTLQKKLVVSDGTDKQSICALCPTRDQDEMFFFACSGEGSVQAIMANGDSASMYKKAIRVDKGFPQEKFVVKKGISSLHCHPTRPLLFVLFASGGSVQVWNYNGLMRKMYKQFGGDGEGSDDGGGGGGGGSGGGQDDNASDNGSVHSRTSKTSHALRASVVGLFGGGPPKEQKLLARALLKCPASVASASTGNIPLHFAMDAQGSLAAVVWEKGEVAVYNILSFPDGGTSVVQLVPVAVFDKLPKPNWKLGPVCFHSLEPLLLLMVEQHVPEAGGGGGSDSKGILCGLSLLDASLRLVSRLDEVVPSSSSSPMPMFRSQLPTSISCLPQSGRIVLAYELNAPPPIFTAANAAAARKARMSLMSFTLDGLWRHLSSPLVTRLAVPADTYLEGDVVLMQQQQQHWPLMLAIKPTISICSSSSSSISSSSGVAPVSVSWNVFRVHLASLVGTESVASSFASSFTPPTVLLGSLGEQSQHQSSWLLGLRAEHLQQHATAAPFCPLHLRIDETVPPKADNEVFYALVPGVQLLEASLGQVWRVPAVYFLRHDHSQAASLQSTLTNFCDAAFWCGPSEGVVCPSGGRVGVLALAADGTTLKWLLLQGHQPPPQDEPQPQQQQQQQPQGPGFELDAWELDAPMSGLWTAPLGAWNVVLFASKIDYEVQSLLLTAPGSASSISCSQRFDLEPNEMVTEVQWQPLPSPFGFRASSSSSEERRKHAVWLPCDAVQLQAPILPLSQGDSSSEQSQHGDGAYAPSCPLLGILTNKRVLIFRVDQRRNLRLQSSVNYHALHHHATSISWVGSVLLYSTESGAVHYLLPSPLPSCLVPAHLLPEQQHQQMQQKQDEQELVLALRHSLGLSHQTKEDGAAHLFCSLPLAISQSGSLRVVACLPDRLVFASTAADNGSPHLCFVARPCLPAEPLILGLLGVSTMTTAIPEAKIEAAPSFSSVLAFTTSSTSIMPMQPRGEENVFATSSIDAVALETQRRDIIANIATMYFPAKLLSGTRDDAGALPTSQATRRLCQALLEAGTDFIVLAAAIAGTLPNAEAAVYPQQPQTRWLPPGFKFQVALRAKKVDQACLDLLLCHPELQEVCDAPKNFVDFADLPHPQSSVALQLSSAARLLQAEGHLDAAFRLFDMAGNDQELANMLLQEYEADKNARRVDVENMIEKLQGINPALQQRLRERLAGESSNTSSSNNSIIIEVNNVVGFTRRKAMLGLSKPLSSSSSSTVAPVRAAASKQVVSAAPTFIDLASFEAAQRQHVSRRGGGLGPPTKLGVLAMDQQEDWFGSRLRLEEVSEGGADIPDFLERTIDGDSGGATGGGGTRGEGRGGRGGGGDRDDQGTAAAMPDGSARPVSWVEDVGKGKDWDKVVGYFRFSDAFGPGDDDFSSSGFPGARLSFVDLSKYAGSIELVAPTSSAISLQETTSNVEPGDHEKQKALFDVVYLQGPSSSSSSNNNRIVESGLRVVAPRGGPLDVGMYHSEPERCKLTLEMCVYFSGSTADLAAANSSSCLAKRVLGLPPALESEAGNEHGEVMWSLSVSATGAICFSSGTSTASGSELKSAPGVVNLGPTSDVPASTWTHIALVVDSSSGGGTEATVILYVNGEFATKKEKMPLAAFSEADLAATTLYVGPNLAAGWRLTELRIWSYVRLSVEIDTQKENSLAIASKRKRLQLAQFKTKGAKKYLFAPLNAESLVPGEASSIICTPVEITANATSSSSSSTLPSADTGSKNGSGFLTAPSSATSGLLAKKRESLMPLPPSSGGGAGGRLAPKRGSLMPPSSSSSSSSSSLSTPSLASISEAKEGNVDVDAEAASRQEQQQQQQTESLHTNTHFSISPSFALELCSDFATLSALKVSEKEVRNCLRTKPLGQPTSMLLRVHKAATPASSSSSSSSAAAASSSSSEDVVLLQLATSTTLPLHLPLSSPIDSVLHGTPYIKANAPPRTTIAVSANKTLFVFDISKLLEASAANKLTEDGRLRRVQAASEISEGTSSGASVVDGSSSEVITEVGDEGGEGEKEALVKKVGEQAMGEKSPPLVFWTYTGSETLLLILAYTVYMWKPEASGDAAKPVKLFDRLDIPDPKKWADRRVVDVSTSPDGWAMLTTCARVKEVSGEGGAVTKQPVTQAEALASCFVTLHHVKSKRGLCIRGVGGCFRSGRAIIFAYPPVLSNASTSSTFSAYSIELASIKESAAATTSAEPLELANLNLQNSNAASVALQWRLPLLAPAHSSLIAGEAAPPSPGGYACAVGDYVFFVTFEGYLTVCGAVSGKLLASGALFDANSYIVLSACIDVVTNPQAPSLVLLVQASKHSSGVSKSIRVALGPLVSKIRQKTQE